MGDRFPVRRADLRDRPDGDHADAAHLAAEYADCESTSLEGIILDPLGALFAVLVFEAIVTRQQGHSFAVFGATVGIGAGVGLAIAAALAFVLYREMIPEYLQAYGTLIAVLGGIHARQPAGR